MDYNQKISGIVLGTLLLLSGYFCISDLITPDYKIGDGDELCILYDQYVLYDQHVGHDALFMNIGSLEIQDNGNQYEITNWGNIPRYTLYFKNEETERIDLIQNNLSVIKIHYTHLGNIQGVEQYGSIFNLQDGRSIIKYGRADEFIFNNEGW